MSGVRTMPPPPPPSYPYHREFSSRFDTDGYERDRGVRHNHRSRSRSPMRRIIDEFEFGDSYRAERSLVRYQFPPRTWHPKDSASIPYVQKDHHGVSDKRESGFHGVNGMNVSKPIPTFGPSTKTPFKTQRNGDGPGVRIIPPRRLSLPPRHVPPYGSSTNNPYGPLPPRHVPPPYGPSINNPFTPQHNGDYSFPSRPSETKVEKTVFDAVHDPSQSSKDISIQFDLPIEQDLSPYLDDFCRFRRLGRFKEARDLYQSKLAKHSTIPYILIHYAEMLVVSGDYKSFQELIYPSRDEQKDSKSATDGKLKTNFELLKLVTRSPVWNYTIAAMETVRGVLEDLADEQVMGSTEVQLLSLCLQVLSYLKSSSHSQVVSQAVQDAKALLDLELIYYRLLSEARIWDFRDLLISAVSLFGWPETIAMLFKSKDTDTSLARIHEDWAQLGNDESIILGLLDVFTSLMLQTRPIDQPPHLPPPALVEHARIFAESVQKDNADNMNTRPFIQWILAKTWWETRPTPRGATIDDFQGLLLEQGDDIHLPVFVPINHSEKPGWAMVTVRSKAAQRSAVEVALGAAMEGDDLYLQALALKILCRQSQDPMKLLDVLSALQLDLQGDIEGFLGTCLARYLLLQGQNEADEKALLRSLKQLDNVSGNSYLHSGINPSFLWARDVIQDHISTKVTGEQTQSPSWGRNLRIYGPRLPQYIATFIEDNFRLNVPPPMSISFNIIGKKNTNKDADAPPKRVSFKITDHKDTQKGANPSPSPPPYPQYPTYELDREDWRNRPASPVYDRTGQPPPATHNTVRDPYPRDSYHRDPHPRDSYHRDPHHRDYDSYDDEHWSDDPEGYARRSWSSRDESAHQRDKEFDRLELERVKAEVAALKLDNDKRKLDNELRKQNLAQEQAHEDRDALARERLERLGLPAEKPEMPNLYHERQNVKPSEPPAHEGKPTGDQGTADNGHNNSTKTNMELKVEADRKELSFSSKFLKDNTVTIIVRNTDNPEETGYYQMDSTGFLFKPAREMDDKELAALAKVSRADFGPTPKERKQDDPSRTAQPPLVHRSTLPKGATVVTLPENDSHDSEEAIANALGIGKETNATSTPTTGKGTGPTTIKPSKQQHLAKSTLRAQNRSSSRASASSADSSSQLKPAAAARKHKGTGDWPKNNPTTKESSSDPTQKAPPPPHKPLSEEVIGELNAEAAARQLRTRGTWDTRAERDSKPDLGVDAGGPDDDDDDGWDGPRVFDLDDLKNNTNRMDRAPTPPPRRSTMEGTPVENAPAPPPRRSTVENADDEEDWIRPTAAVAAKKDAETPLITGKFPSTSKKGEEKASSSKKGGPAQKASSSNNPTTGSAAANNNNQKIAEDAEENNSEYEWARKISERLTGANEYIDQDLPL
ncbi:hypothetical protein QBC45DRAFT_414443 [Copromyces sp. CBS 386.78]|nr:hypothetical protein QBC45DRAFT_414443 [Copromyces sp. CBS 386.78]